MMTQTDIAEHFKSKYGTKINQVRISRMLSGKEPISWTFASDLANEFPCKDVRGWKYATPEDLRRAFEQLNIKNVA
nr:hypothetical protein [uncultured Desulfobacter sp.]